TQQAKIAADDGDSDDDFGASVALSSDSPTALIGASNDEDPNGDQAGSAYVFE
ncbi:FG-GAP repeat protein, partial [Haloarcula laminariae]|uniref:FG-GAP repeat protein n=1 Tax=Haloarcula laminariae TaxID=2961577 RepID=UPI00240531B5